MTTIVAGMTYSCCIVWGLRYELYIMEKFKALVTGQSEDNDGVVRVFTGGKDLQMDYSSVG